MSPPIESTMEGGGFYNRHSAGHHAINAKTTGFFVRAVEAAGLNDDGSFSIADFGAAQGANSLEPIRAAVAALRNRSAGPITVHHVDLPTNDFSALFHEIEASPHTYLQKDVYPCAIGRSFYESVLPKGQLSAAWCASSLHWLSRAPAPLPDHLWVHGADAATLAAWDEASRHDYLTFLEHRARELRPGGQMVLCAGVRHPQTGFVGPDRLLDLAYATARTLVDEGLLGASELSRMTLPCLFRTREAFLAPFAGGHLDAACGHVLEIVHVEEIPVPPVLLERWRQDGDAAAYARDTAAALRAWSAPVLRQQLDADRSPGQAEKIIEALYDRMEAALAACPEDYEPRWTQLMLWASRS